MPEPTIGVGATHARGVGRVDADAVVAYALATNDPNEVYLDGRAVPPLFTASLIEPAFQEASRRSIEPGAISGARGGVHAQHDVLFRRPVLAGMALQWQVSTYCARQTPAGAMVTQHVVVSDAEGSPLVEHFWSSIHIGGTVATELGPVLADHTFPAGARARPVGSHVFDVTRDQSFRYAGASGDRVAHSIDDAAAREEGFPGKILQGLCTLAMCSGAVVEIGARGDPHALRRLAGRFSSPTFPGHQLVVTVYDVGATADRHKALAFEAVAGGVTVVKHGRAELGPS